MYYWVNQGKTYTEEKDGGYLWAPINNNNGRSFSHWDKMDKIVPGDVIFNFKKGVVLGYCIGESYSYISISRVSSPRIWVGKLTVGWLMQNI